MKFNDPSDHDQVIRLVLEQIPVAISILRHTLGPFKQDSNESHEGAHFTSESLELVQGL
jgi:hypothetical protein